MLNQTTNKIQSLGFGYKKIDAIKHQLIINGASALLVTTFFNINLSYIFYDFNIYLTEKYK